MTDTTPTDRRGVVTLEFDVGEAELFFVKASNEAECEVTLEELMQRSDGTVLEFLTVRGAEPDRLLELADEAPNIREARLIADNGQECLFEFIVSGSRIAESLADNETIFKRVTATTGEGRVVAEVPPHVDPGAVIETFLANYPGSELVARRESDRPAPVFTAHEFRNQLVTRLTDKQLETLRVAYSNGYFGWPRECELGEIAETLGVSKPTVSQHLRVAQNKVFETLFED